MVVTKEEVFNLSQEQINTLELPVLAVYVRRLQAGIFLRVANKLGIKQSYVSDIVSGKRKAKTYRPLVDKGVREELQTYIENNQLSNEPSKD